VVENPLFDDGNEVATNGKKVGWNHSGISDRKLGFPVRTDRRLAFEDGSVRNIGPLNVVGHHGQQVVDPSFVEAAVSALQKDDPLSAVHFFSLTSQTVPKRRISSSSRSGGPVHGYPGDPWNTSTVRALILQPGP